MKQTEEVLSQLDKGIHQLNTLTEELQVVSAKVRDVLEELEAAELGRNDDA